MTAEAEPKRMVRCVAGLSVRNHYHYRQLQPKPPNRRLGCSVSYIDMLIVEVCVT